VIGQIAASSSLVIETTSTPGFGNVSRPAYRSDPGLPRATNSTPDSVAAGLPRAAAGTTGT
jgi:hypothetical protein